MKQSTYRFYIASIFAAILLCSSGAAFAQLQWNSYNNAGALVTANVASGGDATYGGTVSFTVPAGAQLIFMTKTFAPINLTNASASRKVYFTMTSSGGITGAGGSRAFGMGLFNDPGTPNNALDDAGFWTDFTTSFEMFDRPANDAAATSFFVFNSTDKQGTGHSGSGAPTDGNTYGMQFQLNVNSANTGISEGTSSSSYAVGGSGMTNITGSAVTAISYINPVLFTAQGVSNFNEFAFDFDNTTVNPITVTLGAINLTPVNPVLSQQPVAFGGGAGATASFSVALNTNTATNLLSEQWYQIIGGVTNALSDGPTGNGSTISGSATTNLTFANAQIADSSSVFFVATNSYGAVTSSVVALVISPPFAPIINSVQPDNATVIAGNSTNITVSAIAVPSATYYWSNNIGSLIQSGPSPILTLANVQPLDAGTYSVTASNEVSMVTSNFTIAVIVTPSISSQPTNVLLNAGDPANFSVTASGTPTPAYQWYKNNILISGATAANYSIASVALTDIAEYSVTVSNAAGTVTSSNAKLAIYSTMLGTPALPANNATGLCVDTYFQISFNTTPAPGNAGAVRIYDASNPSTPVDTIDMSQNNNLNVQPHSLFSGDSQVINYYPVIITGNTATIYPHSGVLTTNKTYYITMDPGVIVDSSGAYFTGIAATNIWGFTTKSNGPVNSTNLVVAADGTGDFVTVQGAVDSIPAGNNNYTVVNVHNGNYVEIVDISGKSNITFYGQSRAGAVVGYPNNNNLTGTTAARMAFKVNAADIKLQNLTITNGTPQGGSQAEALLIYNNGLRCVVDNCTIVSRQDTILINANTSQGYFNNSTVIGNFDYVWGVGVGYFNNCIFRTITNSQSTSYNLTAARTATSASLSATTPWVDPNNTTYSAYGFSFVNCTFTEDPGVTGIMLADANGTPGGLVAWVNCTFDTNAYVNPAAAINGQYVFWQFNNTNSTATGPATFSQVQTIGVPSNDPRLAAATNVVTWFSGWSPGLQPYITTQPAGETVAATQNAAFSVSAGGVPDPTYQWTFDGTNLVGQTGSMLDVTNASGLNIGTYAVIVSNSVSSIASTNVALTVTEPTTPSAASAPSLLGGVFQFTVNGAPGSAGFGYRVWSTTNVALTPVTSTWTLVTNGIFGTGSTVISDPSAIGQPQQYYLITVP
ncbi:MAG TPA: pectinesterase family protein [Verrucomicrobiae bacterium]